MIRVNKEHYGWVWTGCPRFCVIIVKKVEERDPDIQIIQCFLLLKWFIKLVHGFFGGKNFSDVVKRIKTGEF